MKKVTPEAARSAMQFLVKKMETEFRGLAPDSVTIDKTAGGEVILRELVENAPAHDVYLHVQEKGIINKKFEVEFAGSGGDVMALLRHVAQNGNAKPIW